MILTGKSDLVKQLKTFQVNVNFEKDTHFLVKIIIIGLKMSSFLQVSLKIFLCQTITNISTILETELECKGAYITAFLRTKIRLLQCSFFCI